MLNKTDIQRIREEAEMEHPNETGTFKEMPNQSKVILQRRAYIKAATLYQERINGLVEALELIKMGYPTNQSVMIADKALDTYNKTINNEEIGQAKGV